MPASNGVLNVTVSLQTNPSKRDQARSASLRYQLDIGVKDRNGRSITSVHEKKKERFPLMKADAMAARAIEKTVQQTLRQQMLKTLNKIAGVKG